MFRTRSKGHRVSSRFFAVAVHAVALALAGCAGEEAPAGSVRLDAARDGALLFERGSVTTTPGRKSVEMANPSGIPHAVGIRGQGVDESGQTVGKGGMSRVEADLRPGTYTVFCPVGGHEKAGMTARLVVR